MTNDQAALYLSRVYATTKNGSYASALACAIATLKSEKPAPSLDCEKKDCILCHYEDDDDGMPIYYPSDWDNGIGFEHDHAIFCPRCGRPLTNAAREKFRERLGGTPDG